MYKKYSSLKNKCMTFRQIILPQIMYAERNDEFCQFILKCFCCCWFLFRQELMGFKSSKLRKVMLCVSLPRRPKYNHTLQWYIQIKNIKSIIDTNNKECTWRSRVFRSRVYKNTPSDNKVWKSAFEDSFITACFAGFKICGYCYDFPKIPGSCRKTLRNSRKYNTI